MARYLAIFRDNHGEEFDVHGFKIMTEKEVNDFEELANSITYPFEYYANSECLSYTNGEDFFSRISFKEISKEEYNTLKKIFNGEFGMFIGEEYLTTILEGEEEQEIGDEDIIDEWD
jgi:phosphopantetheinyl transferase (holo-ACP synthase)